MSTGWEDVFFLEKKKNKTIRPLISRVKLVKNTQLRTLQIPSNYVPSFKELP